MEMTYQLHLGDCLDVLATLPDNSVDSIVTDPPYGLSFMGKKWDYDVPSVAIWEQCLRVLKPGGHLLAFAGTRTQHRMACRIEDAGFEIRDMIAWVYGSGFPKSLDVSKAIDKASGVEREVVGSRKLTGTARIKGQAAYGATSGRSDDAYQDGSEINDTLPLTAPATPEAQQWAGWGTALKPALEPITMARKPLDGTVAANVLAHGTGALNIDRCRVATSDSLGGGDQSASTKTKLEGWDRPWMQDEAAKAAHSERVNANVAKAEVLGRWPANLIHDGSDEATAGLADSARYFYTAKASRDDRSDGNTHPTVKPTDLMRYLCRLVTPPGGIVLDPFMGSGSTGKAAMLEGLEFIGIEREVAYHAIAEIRIGRAAAAGYQPSLLP